MEIGTVRRIDIDDEMKGSYLDYAMSVIVARALPDASDGLKPVHRRILYAMYDMGLRHDRPYKKSARIVGEVLGKYHPHGDAAVYDAMVRMAQDFSMRYRLVDGQGNFGSVDGDSAAAMRYTEARLDAIAAGMLADIDRDTVDFVDNFDGTLQEPSVLPAMLPNLLLNGASGIAVGMATNIPPHNLSEVCDGLIYLIDNYDSIDDIAPDDLRRLIKGPDFPTGAVILGEEGIRNAYATGKGLVVMRAKAHIEEMRGNRQRIVVSQLPYQVNKSRLIERIAELVRAKRIDSISDLRDESDRHGMSIVIELKRGAQPRAVLNQLFKYTQMQSTFGVNMLALVDGEPRVLTLKRMMAHYIEHRREIITRRTQHDLAKAKERAHILEGLRIALEHLDEVIATIRRSRTVDTARTNLRRKFKLTEAQANAILEMQLRRLAALERKRIEDEYTETIKHIAYYEDLLAKPRKILHLIKEDLKALQADYGDARRTLISPDAGGDLSEEDLVPEEDVLITLTQRGYIKRVLATTYSRQRRGGRGITGAGTREEDVVQHLLLANTLDSLLFFTDQGKVYHERAYQVPDVGRRAKGLPLINLIALERRESVTAVIAVPSFEHKGYLVMATKNGRIKRTSLDDFASVRPSGLIAINLEVGDELGWVKLTNGKQEVAIVTRGGQAIRFPEGDVRPMGRAAAGVMAIKLEGEDQVAAMDVARPGADLLVVTEKGFGKRTPVKDYPLQSRYGKGVLSIDVKRLDEVGCIVDARVVDPKDEVTLISAKGMVLRTPVENISQMGRPTRGVKVMNLKAGDSVASVAVINRKRKK
ncbi:MAG: DNA gyrase subunit A [Anaerolineae bacterium]|nr:DNA gyrase subunit A [Anaerolineae bacterium]NIN93878.1 DNA gyrase subunit A [Anaerolineae bacterium]NIQ76911.1 DNA gyrase subunit A [Anaerolineae bacterium]